jgi:hypothetical protein
VMIFHSRVRNRNGFRLTKIPENLAVSQFDTKHFSSSVGRIIVTVRQKFSDNEPAHNL